LVFGLVKWFWRTTNKAKRGRGGGEVMMEIASGRRLPEARLKTAPPKCSQPSRHAIISPFWPFSLVLLSTL